MALTVGLDDHDRLHAVDDTTRLKFSLCGQLPHRHVHELAWHELTDDPRERCARCSRRAAELVPD